MLILACLCGGMVWADNAKEDTISVRGQVVDYFTREVVDSVFMEVLMPDSTTVVDTLWNLRKNKMNMGVWGEWEMQGYTFKLPHHGKYLLRCTKRGYKPSVTPLDIPRKRYNKKVKEWENDEIMLKRSNSYDFDTEMQEVTVKATRIKMFQDGDTVVYNADAFELSDGSMLDELIRQLPGVELKDGGEIFVNGHKVDELMLNGKHFFKGDAKVALDNLPAYMVNNVKAYQRADDKAYLDKHHEEMKKNDPWVIDVNLKREYNTGWIGNVEAGYGTEDHYLGRLFLTRFTDHSRLTLYGSSNDINNHGQPGSEGSWSDWSSPTSQMKLINAGIDFHVDSRTNKTEMNTQLTYSGTDVTSNTDVSGVTFLPSGDVYNRNRNRNDSKTHTLNWSLDLSMPKKESYFTISPNLSWSSTKSNGFNMSATFNDDPGDAYRGQSLDSIFAPIGSARLEKFLVNRSFDITKGQQTSIATGLNTYYYKVAPWNGETLNLSASFSYNKAEGKDFSQYDLYQPASSGMDAVNDYRNRYTFSPTEAVNARLSLGHELWEFKFGTLGLQYDFNYTYNKGQRDLHRLDELNGWGQNAKRPIGLLPSTTDSLNACIDWANSFHTQNRNVEHNTQLRVQKGGDWGFYMMSVGLRNYNRHMEDTRDHMDRNLTRRFNLPEISGFFKLKDWEGGINFSQSSPSMDYLLDVRDDSNPLSVSMGNANLKNSSNETVSLNYSHNNMEKQNNWRVGANVSFNQNSIGNAMTYNRQTGVYTYRPENISGNMNANLDGITSVTLDKNKLLTLSSMTSMGYQRSVDFMQETTTDTPVESVEQLSISRVHNFTLSDEMNLRFQKGGYTVSLNAQANYMHANSKRENFHTINTVDFSYGTSCSLKLPWSLQFDMDLTMHSRRGYEDETMNENNLVWNAALSKSMLKKKSLIVKVIGHDILQQLSSVHRSINAQGRTETWYNTQPAYGLLTLAYKLNIMPKKKK